MMKTLTFLLLFAGLAYAQTLKPNGPKKEIMIEDSQVKLTLREPGSTHPRGGHILSVYLRVENKGDAALEVDPAKFYATGPDGRAYQGLDFEEAMKRFNDAHAIGRDVLAGPLRSHDVERKTIDNLRQVSFQTGTVPSHSFRDGLIYFEAPNKIKKKGTVELHLVGLWLEPFSAMLD